MGKSKRSGEFELISRFFAPLASDPGALGLADDAAILASEAGVDTVVTTDTLIAGVHFPAAEDPETVAARLLAVNLSDLAAMGARPLAYTLSLALAEDWDDDWVGDFAASLGREQAAYGLQLIGGDTVATPGPLTLTLTAFGRVAEGTALTRGGAKPGDDVYVSGTIGDAALGLRAVTGAIEGLDPAFAEHLADRFRRPRPRVELGQRLIAVAHAAIDVSDGLVADCGHVARASGCEAVLEADKVPLSEAAMAAIALDPALREVAMTGGDDYELLFAAPPGAEASVRGLADGIGVAVTAIGRIGEASDDGGEVRVVDGEGRPLHLANRGYRHF